MYYDIYHTRAKQCVLTSTYCCEGQTVLIKGGGISDNEWSVDTTTTGYGYMNHCALFI